MSDSLTRLRDRMTRKALRNFVESPKVTYADFIEFVNYKMGTEIHDHFAEACYEHFIQERERKKEESLIAKR